MTVRQIPVAAHRRYSPKEQFPSGAAFLISIFGILKWIW
ncbi:hypothetical protein SAMN05661091_5152 [Paenibacillus uliginis N3/975]|uniref:Uncharacterized protein n=1 Tax=Paenibacillus uliginis N3/975 TaxID=1313296 RepID=A0A1X7HPQ8_9BACL|nr:hypothetical protein SAMN05661091_5152 [Paenibacillus uliginis N3/975]